LTVPKRASGRVFRFAVLLRVYRILRWFDDSGGFRELVDKELGALLDKEFLAQDLPELTPKAEMASELISEAI
jgi:hypothetical protein